MFFNRTKTNYLSNKKQKFAQKIFSFIFHYYKSHIVHTYTCYIFEHVIAKCFKTKKKYKTMQNKKLNNNIIH